MSEPIEKPIIKQNTRILTPYLYKLLRPELNPTYQAVSDALLHTGMRAEELWEFLHHPEWYDPKRKCIDMPIGSIKKKKCLHKERTVVLTQNGCKAIEYILQMKPQKIQRQDMWITYKGASERAGIGVKGITTKMFRKSMISWLAVVYPDVMFKIASSAGHSLETMRLHYSNLQFEARDLQEMREFLKGWGEA
jgi:site-specific recombinase XerD